MHSNELAASSRSRMQYVLEKTLYYIISAKTLFIEPSENSKQTEIIQNWQANICLKEMKESVCIDFLMFERGVCMIIV